MTQTYSFDPAFKQARRHHRRVGLTRPLASLRRAAQLVQRLDQSVQRARGGFDRIVSVIHAEEEQKRTRPNGLPDRVEGRIESLIQSRMRSREHDIGR